MKKVFFLVGSLCIYCSVLAQDKAIKEIHSTSEKKIAEDTTHKNGWKKGAIYSLGIGQGGSSNWAAGAEKFSFSLAANMSLFANWKEGRSNWKNNLDLGYALVNTTSQGVRKTDDKIDLYSKYGYDLTQKLALSFVGNLRSQFTAGYDYDYLGKKLKRKTSGWFAPAYLILAPGFDYHPTSYFSIFFSPISSRFVFVTGDPKSYYYQNGDIPGGGFETPLAVLYGVDPARKVRAEVGGFASINFNRELIKNVSYKSRLDLYSNYLKTYKYEVTGPDQLNVIKNGASPEKVDIFWTNLISMKVNKMLSVSFSADIIYDDDVRQFGVNNNSAAMQFRSQLTVGLAGRF
jgi:hypothetical protein